MARKQLSGVNQNNSPLTNIPAPTAGGDAANKTYVDTAVQNRMRVYDVRDYGAVANGTTNDSTAIKAAMDAANSAGGGIVQLMPGTHAFTASITGAYKNITIRGYPNVTICKATGSFTNGMFNFDANTTSSENIIIEDVMLDVNNQTNVHGVTIKGGTFASGAYAKNFTFRRVSAKNLLTVDIGLVTIYTGRGATDRGKVTDIKFIDCDFQETSKYHVFVIGGQAEDYRFTNCKFRNSQYGCIGINQPNKKNSANAIGTRSSKNWVIEGCTFTNNHLSNTALFAFLGGFTDSNRSGIRSLKFLNCRFEGNGDANTTIEQYAMSIHSSWDVIIQGCTFWKIRTFLNVGQSYNGPWYQEDGTQFLTIRDNTFYQLYNVVDHDSAFFATWDNNKFIEIFYWGIGGYSRHWPSVYTNNYFYNTPCDPTVSAERTGLFYIDGRDGFEVRNNIFIDDRKLADPTSAASTTTVAGGSLSARTYYVKYVYRNDTGTTLASPSTTQAVAANSLLKFDFPYTATYGPPSGAKWVDIYVGTTLGSETLQTSQPVAWQQETETVLSQNFGPITWTEPSTGLVDGAALPSSNTTKYIAKYAIYEGDTEVGGPRYNNRYTGNRAYGMEFLRRNSAWSSLDKDNWYTPDLTVSSAVAILSEAVIYVMGNITGNVTFNPSIKRVQSATMTGNVTATLQNGAYVGQELERRFTMGGSGGYTYTKSSNERLAGGLFTPSNAAGSTDILVQEWDGTNWVEKKRIMGLA
jgi:hypothetical protein